VLVWNTVFFGLLAGLMFVPVVLSVAGGGVHKTKAIQLLGLIEDEGSFGNPNYHQFSSPGSLASSFARRRHIPLA
jgi:hypothetical protein